LISTQKLIQILTASLVLLIIVFSIISVGLHILPISLDGSQEASDFRTIRSIGLGLIVLACSNFVLLVLALALHLLVKSDKRNTE
jgi:uncharacterized membrane protein